MWCFVLGPLLLFGSWCLVSDICLNYGVTTVKTLYSNIFITAKFFAMSNLNSLQQKFSLTSNYLLTVSLKRGLAVSE